MGLSVVLAIQQGALERHGDYDCLLTTWQRAKNALRYCGSLCYCFIYPLEVIAKLAQEQACLAKHFWSVPPICPAVEAGQ